MSDEKEVQVTDQKEQPKAEQINIDVGTAFNLKLQEFDKKIAEAEHAVATLKKDKAAYIYDQNVQQIVFNHKEQMLKNQIEQETKKKLAEQQAR
jgi:hypothetical protein